MTTQRFEAARFPRALACAAALFVVGCSGEHTPTDQTTAIAGLLEPLILSNPTALPPATVGVGLAPLVDAVVYASLPPGSLPDAELVQFTNPRSGAGATAVVVDGGFDPVPMPAAVGDSILVRVQLRDKRADRLFYAKVPPRRPPVIVRTDPPPGRRDVPLNARLLVVFSEPLAALSAGDSAMTLITGVMRVAGSLAFADEERLSLVFTPAAPLAAGASYTLQVTTAVRDRDGEGLEDPASIGFSTATLAGQVPTGAPAGALPVNDFPMVLERIGLHSGSYPHSRILLTSWNGQFELQSFGDALLDTVRFPGRYEITDSSIRFTLDAGSTAGRYEAEGIIRSDTVHVRFNEVANMSDFEDGAYLLVRGGVAEQVAPLPDARAGARAAVWNGSIFVIGGIDASGAPAAEIQAYDPTQNRWRSAGRLERPVWQPGLAVVGDRIYVIGGSIGSAIVQDVQLYEPATGRVSLQPPLPEGRSGVATAVFDGVVHVMGGRRIDPNSGRSVALADHDVLDPNTGTWSPAPALPVAGSYAAAVLGSRAFLVGGAEAALVYDAATRTWEQSVRLGGDWGDPGAAVLDGRLYVTIGVDAWGCGGHVSSYDLDLTRGEGMSYMMTPRCFAAVTEFDGSLYVFGGTRETDRVSPTSPAIRLANRLSLRR